MAISINPATYVITIPKTDTTYVTTNAITGYEIRSYDEYVFMRQLADYLDSEVGAALPYAYTHNTSITISGVVYARALVILAPYTVTFQSSGDYQVKLIGGTNNNMLDVLNPNNVSVIPANSAGLQQVTGGYDPVLDEVIEGAYTLRQIIRIIAAHAAGSATGLEGSNPEFTGLDGTTTRITATYTGGTRNVTLLEGD